LGARSIVIEVEVHQRLRALLREQGYTQWPHHLTMARLVARALRLGRSSLIQTGASATYQGVHRLSYLIPALLWPEPAVLAVPERFHSALKADIADLVQNLPALKSIHEGNCWPYPDFRGIVLTTPQAWLKGQRQQPQAFPPGIPTVIDGADELENWVHAILTQPLGSAEWEALMLAYPSEQTFIREMRVRLTHTVFQHPANPYNCYLLDEPEQTLMLELHDMLAYSTLGPQAFPPAWQRFWQQFFHTDRLSWIQVDRQQGSFILHCGPAHLAEHMSLCWQAQPLVVVGAALDADPQALTYRQQLGLGEMTCVKFASDRQQDLIHLSLNERLPLPNTSHFQAAVLAEIGSLLSSRIARTQLTVVLVGDEPLKIQLGTHLAAEFGSRTQVEKKHLASNGILVSGWEFWRTHQHRLPSPGLMIITTLPIPSLENPLVAGRVAHFKRLRQDWFRLYLLPMALRELQLAIAPVRAQQGSVVLLDNRLHHRSYGKQFLNVLSPSARVPHLEEVDFLEDLSNDVSTDVSNDWMA
jgi:ATP-dependent DNA helicase DinG